MRRLDLFSEDIIRWGRIFSSDVVIHGKCEIINSEMIFISLKAFDVEKGSMINQYSQLERIVEDFSSEGPVIHPIERTINIVAIKMAPELIKAIEVREAKINKLEVELKGLKNFEQFKRFRDFLKKDIDGVKSVIQRRIRGTSMSVLVEFSGGSDKFFNTIFDHELFPFPADMIKTEKGEIIISIK